MAKSNPTMYFAVKLVAATFGKQLAQRVAVPETTIMVDRLSVAFESGSGETSYVRIGGKAGAAYHGVAGHFTAHFLDFTEEEDRKCKTLAEAERLVQKNYKAWLTDAYDWYVAPVEIGALSQIDGKAAKSSKPSSKAGPKKPSKK